MQRLEVVMSAAGNMFLVEGTQSFGASWQLTDEFVQILDANGTALAQGPLGPVGRAVLPKLFEIDVIAVGPNGPADLRKVRRAA